MNQNFQPDKEYFSSSQEEVEIQKNDWALGELVKKVLYPQSTELAVEACENGHQKGILKNSLNPIAELLSQIDTKELIEELNFSEELTEQEQKLLPKLLKLLTIQTQKSGQSSEQDSGILQQLEKSPTRERLQLMLHYLQGAIGQLLGFDDFRILDSQLGFFDMGMNHTMMLELKNRLETSFGCSISVTTLSEHYNIQELAKYLITKIFVGEIEEKYAIDKYEKQQTIVETELKQ